MKRNWWESASSLKTTLLHFASLLAILAACTINQVTHISSLKEHSYLEKTLIENWNTCEESVTVKLFTEKH